MENTVSVNLSSSQLILSLALQVWIIVFPILILKKLNYMISVLQDHFGTDRES